MADPTTLITADALRSPLCHLKPSSGTPGGHACLQAAEMPNLGYIVLRGKASDAAFMSGVATVIGAQLPTAPKSYVRCEAGIVLWQSPDEWWLICARAQRDALMSGLLVAVKDCFAQVVDNSGGFTAVRINGPLHGRLLAHLSPYDFDRLAVGQCVSTVVSKAAYTVVRSDTMGVTLVFRRSFADYIWKLIDRNAQPYGLQVIDTSKCSDELFQPLLAPRQKAALASV